MRHIGIVACSAEGAALCYRTICTEGEKTLGERWAHPEVSMHTPSLADYARCLDRGDVAGVAELMLSSARKLAAAGADFFICPDNTIHMALPRVEPRSPAPWLHIADVVAAEAAAHGFRKVGLTGTRWLVDSEVYPPRLAARGMQCVRPEPGARADLQRIIMDELVRSEFHAASTSRCVGIIEELKASGCDAVILGCTELPLILSDANSPLPTLDSTRLLARAALRHAAAKR
jgi:aspartate racemase